MERHSSPTLVVQDVAGLRELATRSPLRMIHGGAAVSLRIDGLGERESARFERLLTRYRSACGCEAGAAGLVLFGGGYPLYVALTEGMSGVRSFANLVIWLALSVAGAVAGKGLGLSFARLRLRVVVHELIGRIEHQQSADMPAQRASEVQVQSESLAR